MNSGRCQIDLDCAKIELQFPGAVWTPWAVSGARKDRSGRSLKPFVRGPRLKMVAERCSSIAVVIIVNGDRSWSRKRIGEPWLKYRLFRDTLSVDIRCVTQTTRSYWLENEYQNGGHRSTVSRPVDLMLHLKLQRYHRCCCCFSGRSYPELKSRIGLGEEKDNNHIKSAQATVKKQIEEDSGKEDDPFYFKRSIARKIWRNNHPSILQQCLLCQDHPQLLLLKLLPF